MINSLCGQTENVLAYLQDELNDGTRLRFETHLPICSICQQTLADYQQITEQLKQVPNERPLADISDKVLEQIDARSRQKQRRFRLVATAASILIAVALIFFISYPKNANQQPPNDTISNALDWLARNQEPSGKWNTEKWGGYKQFEVALSGLSIMALAGSEPIQRKKYVSNILKGTDYLISQQARDGGIGPRFSSRLYNHSIASACLLEIYALNKDERLKAPIKSAINYILSTQSPSGGWGYIDDANPLPNSAVSFWVLQSLLLAKSVGFDEVTPSLSRGFQWLISVSDKSGRPGYSTIADFPYGAETLSAMAVFSYTYGGTKYLPQQEKYQLLSKRVSIDVSTSQEVNYYYSYFLAYIESASGEPSQWHKNLTQTLSQSQCITDALRGSWEPTDRWGNVGGRIYTTALSTLALESTTRGPRLKNLLSTISK